MAPAPLQVSVVTPAQALLAAEADAVTAPSVSGEVTILPMHAPLLCDLSIGIVRLGDTPTAPSFVVDGGFLEVAADRVSILAEAAEPLGEINVKAAQADLDDAEAQLKVLSPQDANYSAQAHRAQFARARLQAAR